jgi:hypothetical protein
MPSPSETRRRRPARTNLGGANNEKKPIPILPAETSRWPPTVRQSSFPSLRINWRPVPVTGIPELTQAVASDPAPVQPRPRPAPQKLIDFHFVNLTDPQIDRKTRKSINAHVQRVDRQKKRWERIKRPLQNRERFPARPEPFPCRCQKQSTNLTSLAQSARSGPRVQICSSCGGEFPKDRYTGELLKWEPKLAVLLGQSRKNPFKTYPIEGLPDADMLVDFCKFTITIYIFNL